MSDEPLDRAVWHALATRRGALAIGDGRARRLRPDVGLFIAGADRSAASLAAMAALVGPGEQVATVEAGRWPVPPGLHVVSEAACVQMVAPTCPPGDHRPDIVTLDDTDAPAMLALAELTRPGPFYANTHRFGGFVGIRHEGALIAMAGTRLALPGHVEVSGVCTHPAHRGRGHAAALIRHVSRAIAAGGDRPFLTAYADNAGAIALYEALGFVLRRELLFTVLERG